MRAEGNLNWRQVTASRQNYCRYADLAKQNVLRFWWKLLMLHRMQSLTNARNSIPLEKFPLVSYETNIPSAMSAHEYIIHGVCVCVRCVCVCRVFCLSDVCECESEVLAALSNLILSRHNTHTPPAQHPHTHTENERFDSVSYDCFASWALWLPLSLY